MCAKSILPLHLACALAVLTAPSRATANEVEKLSFEEALHQLERENLTLAQVRSRVAEARAVVEQARAPLLPTLVASGGFTRNSDEAAFSARTMFSNLENALNQSLPVPVHFDPANFPKDMIIQPLHAFTVSGSVRVPLVVPSAWADTFAARSAAGASAATLEATRLDLEAALAQSAWLEVAVEGMVTASEKAVGVAREHRDSAKRTLDAGIGTELALFQAETDLVRRESDLVRARSELERARLAIGVLLGSARMVRVEVAALPEERIDVEASVARGLSLRPELRAGSALIRSAEQQTRSAWMRYLPQLSSSFAAYASDVPYPTFKTYGWKVTVDLNWNLFDGGFAIGKFHQARAALAGAKASLQSQRIEVERQVRDSSREVRVARERLILVEKQRQFAEETAIVAKRSHSAGLASSLDVVDANDRLFLADIALADARSRLGIAQALFGRAVARRVGQ